jgi:hypothetical protein
LYGKIISDIIALKLLKIFTPWPQAVKDRPKKYTTTLQKTKKN